MKTTLLKQLRRLPLLATLLLFVGLTAPVTGWGQQTLVVANGTVTNYEIPFYGLYADDNYQHTQTIYPSSMLTQMQGGTITKLTYHLSSSVTKDYGSTFEVRLGTTNSTSFSTGEVNYISMTGSPAYSNTLSVNGTTVEFNLSTPYTYNGGNLVIDVRLSNLGSGWQSASFYGESGSINYSVKNSSTSSLPTSTGTAVTFMPKTTFTYLSTDPFITLAPQAATVLTGFTQTLTATYGNVSGTPTITYSSSNTSVATVSGSGTTATVTGVAPGTATITASMTYQGTTYTATSAITVEDPSYCTPNPSSVDGKGITSLTFGSGDYVVNNSNSNGLPASSPYYGDYTSMVGGYEAGETATVSITYTTGNTYSSSTIYSYGTIIWVDWNKNYTFEDSEIVYTGTSPQVNNGTPQVLAATFTVPATQAADDYRMRIAGADSYFDSYIGGNTSANHSPCFSSTYAVCHDYTLRVTSAITICEPSWSGSSNHTYIQNFTVRKGSEVLLNSSSNGTYDSTTDYYASRSITANAGDELSLSITPNASGYSYGFAVWIDYDADGFESEDRVVYTIQGVQSFSQNYTIPIGTSGGEYRLRILQAHSAASPSEPCGTYRSGEAEDYKLIVIPSYNITIDPSITHGTITTTPANKAAAGSAVIVNVTPDDGYELVSLTVENPCASDFSEGFGSNIPSTWTTIDYDGDGYNWGWSETLKHHDAEGVAYSQSYDNGDGALTPDNWLITPQLSLWGVASFWYIGQQAGYSAEHLAVYVSTSGKNISDFTQVSEELVAADEYQQCFVDISSYGGQMGYIAIRHFNCTDMFFLNIDDFHISGSEDLDIVQTQQFTMPSCDVTVHATFGKIYDIIISDNIVNGTVTTSPANQAAEGSNVTVTVTPASDYKLATLTVTDENNMPITVLGNTFTMPGSNVTVSAEFELQLCKIEEFDSYPAAGWTSDGIVPTGWEAFTPGYTGTDGYKPHVSGVQYGQVQSDSKFLFMKANSNCNAVYAIMPKFYEIESVEFKYIFNDASNGTLQVGYVTANTEAGCTNFQSLQQLTATASATTAALTATQITSINAAGGYIAFRWSCSSSPSSTTDFICGIDDVEVCVSQAAHLWTHRVTSDPTGSSFNPMDIDTPEKLAWFISYVNNYNDAGAHASADAKLTADIDMSDYIWVPIGNGAPYTGVFDGNFHTITGIHIAGESEIDAVEAGHSNTINVGLFGNTSGTIKNLYVKETNLTNSATNGTLGGIVGSNGGTVQNCYSDVALSGTATKGGLVGANTGTLKNSYTMFTSGVAGSNSGTINYCYNKAADNTNPAEGTFTSAVAYAYGDYTTNNAVTVGSDTKPLVEWLNTSNPDNTVKWIRPKGSLKINDGYPVLVEASTDTVMAVAGVTNDKNIYKGEANAMITTYSTNTNADIYLYGGGTLTTKPTSASLFIDEDASIKLDGVSNVTATVGITIDNSSASGSGSEHRDYHTFASSLVNAPLGITYPNSTEYAQNVEMVEGTHYNMLTTEASYFPTGVAGTNIDYYDFYEPQYHWINLKRNSNSHWHQDNPTQKIYYDQGSTLKHGRGYLLAIGTPDGNHVSDATKKVYLSAKGTLQNGDVKNVEITASGAHLTGYNFLGNPYQSYLDFDAFAEANGEAIWGTYNSEDPKGYHAYLIYDADKGGFDEYLSSNGVSFSQGSLQTASRYIHPHQGFFVVMKGSGTKYIDFKEGMRVTDKGSTFRSDEQPTYPLVNLVCTDDEGKREISVIEVERPSMAGSLRMKGMLGTKANMYIRWDGEDFGNVFLEGTPEYVPVWFKSNEEGVFTMTWSTANDNFGYLHLIDNLTGNDIDMLATDSYAFQSRPSDSKARFRLVFSALGIDEETTTEQGENFAFINGNELVVTGEGELSMIDLNGRVLTTEHLSGQQSHITLPNVAVGMYMLRLTNGKETKVQKIVVRK